MTAAELAAYMEATDKIAQPWLLAQLRLTKLQEQRSELSPEVYAQALADIHGDLMRLGEWWHEQEEDVF
ncbi:hypothetical protein [Synechococcus sp. PCC 6312]|uniref:hypothetical protein n=1 Tax=Synechococcus sp. (strain ATCC 27167 / PCC 6312) TaxID=195253 RepID=UPI00029EF0D4|nr:hypothetical protein [Synechococcus sp. PCC 6312]AFY61541.1 hypothetical protein Syn6312_2439 [Synechococcus sp. PCC 6312]